MGNAEDFWPPMDDVEDATSPVALLRKQADVLSDRTGYRLRGRVTTITSDLPTRAYEALHLDTWPRPDTFTHIFSIEVPSLDNYRYALFSVSHGLEGYPVVSEEEPQGWRAMANPEEFTGWLREVLSSEKTKRILKTLKQQAG